MNDLTYRAAARLIDTRRRIERIIAKRRAVVIAEQLRAMRGTYA